MTADRLRQSLRWCAVAASGLFVLGCGLLPSSGPAVHFDNQTNTPLAVRVKGVWVGTYAPGASANVPLGGQGAPPYNVTIHTPSGNVLLGFDVTAETINAAADGGGTAAGSTGLPCGSVRLSVGPTDEALAPVAVEGLPACP